MWKAKEASNWLMVEAMRLLKEHEMDPDDMGFSPANLAKLIQMVAAGEINRTVAKMYLKRSLSIMWIRLFM